MISEETLRARARAIADVLSNPSLREAGVLGLGTGTTMALFIEQAHRAGILKGKTLVTSSIDTTLRLEGLGYKVTDLQSVSSIDVYVDSADEVDSRGRMIKGGGGAFLREKILASNSREAIFVVDEHKLVNRLGERHTLPVEVVPYAITMVMSRLRSMGLEAELRVAGGKMGPVISDSLGVIVDVRIPKDVDLNRLDAVLKSVAGVMETGLFLKEATLVYVGMLDGKVKIIAGPRRVV